MRLKRVASSRRTVAKHSGSTPRHSRSGTQNVDPKAGRITFKEYAEGWREAQVHRPTSAAHVETMLRRHVYPTFGARAISSVLPSEIQAWVKLLGTHDKAAGRRALAPSTIQVVHAVVSSVFRAAIRDRKIMANPCEGTRLPKSERRRIIPVTTAQVETLREELPDDLKALVTFAAGTGMRRGEILGLTRDRLRLLGTNPLVVLDRQLLARPGRTTEFGPLKTKASYRTIPLPAVVVDALNKHLATRDIADDDLCLHPRWPADQISAGIGSARPAPASPRRQRLHLRGFRSAQPA